MDRLITDSEIRYLLQHLSMFYSGADLAGYMITETAVSHKVEPAGTPGDEPAGAGTGRIPIPRC